MLNSKVIYTAGQPIRGFFGEYRWLSNFWPAPVVYRRDTYPTVEHAFQAAKCAHPNDRQQIMKCSTPGQAKRLGKIVPLRPDWEDVKIDIMIELLIQKFRKNLFKEKLLATENRELVEQNSWGDTFWGVCKGSGENILGRLIMLIRIELRAEGK